jgi:hypothetical protein
LVEGSFKEEDGKDYSDKKLYKKTNWWKGKKVQEISQGKINCNEEDESSDREWGRRKHEAEIRDLLRSDSSEEEGVQNSKRFQHW